jgi:hypothetical protein
MDKETKSLILYAGGAIAAYFLLIQPLLQKLGLQATKEEKKQAEIQEKGKQQFIDEALKKKKPTRPEGNFAVMADQLYEFLKYSAIDDQKQKALELLYQYIHNDADIALLYKYFGKRQEFAFGIPIGKAKNLSEFVSTNLNKSMLDYLNGRYVKNKMTFRF